MTADAIIGWDVGGANLKAVRVDGRTHGVPSAVAMPFPLWREPARLPEMLQAIARTVGPAARMAVTMTAELADCFATKREGVVFVIDAFERAFPDTVVQVWGVDRRFRTPAEARHVPLRVAAANWMATASLVARTVPDTLLIDVGSTTTDIIPIVRGQVAARGRTDTARLRSGELVYTGILRTPVCAIVRTVPVRGRRCRVAAECFAIAADVHRWLGRLSDHDYACETPDGRGRSRAEAGARLARMVCADVEMLGERQVTAIAEHVAHAQIARIAGGIVQVVKRLGPTSPASAHVVGHGGVLGAEAARQLGLAVRTLESTWTTELSRVAPAAAVAWLLHAEQDVRTTAQAITGS